MLIPSNPAATLAATSRSYRFDDAAVAGIGGTSAGSWTAAGSRKNLRGHRCHVGAMRGLKMRFDVARLLARGLTKSADDSPCVLQSLGVVHQPAEPPLEFFIADRSGVLPWHARNRVASRSRPRWEFRMR